MKVVDLNIDWRAVVVGVAIGAAWVAHAEVDHKKARSADELSRILGERAAAEDAREEGITEGELKMLEKLCAAGKLEEEDCAALWE